MSGEYSHRALLNEFRCAEASPRRQVGLAGAHISDDRKPWATKVQRIVRGIRTPMRDGAIVRLRLSEDGTRIDAVLVMKAAYVEGAIRFDLAIAARHLDSKGQGVGDDILECFETTCQKILADNLLRSGLAVSHVHRQNKPMQRLLSSRGWTQLAPEADDDPDYEYWGAVIPAS
ncbi:hypothetical protein ACFRFH_18060 [Leifsonia sp. NPDC056824]|uniref:hypothetical protein n=1 Tax=Leifsonia sp. NPDC056824 TaxID=3345953 RepID=UPI0036B72392